MANIYIAGSYARREELFERAKDLVQAGHTVTSRWLKGNADHSKQDQIDMDLSDLLKADTVLNFAGNGVEGCTAYEYNTGGRHVELGYAMAVNDQARDLGLGRARRLLLVGWPQNVFHHRSDVEQFPTFRQALAALSPETAGTVIAAARAKAASL
jgi:hypothetical protein